MAQRSSGGGAYLSQFLTLAEEEAAAGAAFDVARGFPGQPGLDYTTTWTERLTGAHPQEGWTSHGSEDPLRVAARRLLECPDIDLLIDEGALVAMLDRASARALALDPATGRAIAAGAGATVLKAVFGLMDDQGAPHSMALLGGHGETIDGELDKLAANIAGLSAPDACAASLRVGERIAVDLMRAGMGLAPEPVPMQFASFSGQIIEIAVGAECDVEVRVDGDASRYLDWQAKHAPEPGRTRLRQSA